MTPVSLDLANVTSPALYSPPRQTSFVSASARTSFPSRIAFSGRTFGQETAFKLPKITRITATPKQSDYRSSLYEDNSREIEELLQALQTRVSVSFHLKESKLPQRSYLVFEGICSQTMKLKRPEELAGECEKHLEDLMCSSAIPSPPPKSRELFSCLNRTWESGCEFRTPVGEPVRALYKVLLGAVVIFLFCFSFLNLPEKYLREIVQKCRLFLIPYRSTWIWLCEKLPSMRKSLFKPPT